MKKIVFILIAICITLNSFCQDKNAEAKLLYTTAEDYFNKSTPSDFQSSIYELNEAEKKLGATNPKLLYLKIKAMHGLSDKYFAYDLDSLLKIFFKITSSTTYPEDKYSEIIKIKNDFIQHDYSSSLKPDFKTSADGNFLIGKIFFQYFTDFKDEIHLALSVGYFKSSCQYGNAEAGKYLAWAGLDYHILKNNNLAEYTYKLGADCGNVVSMTRLGEFYGNEINKGYYDIVKAKEWLLKAANLGSIDAMTDLGDYYTGLGAFYKEGFHIEQLTMQEKDVYETGFNWYLKAAMWGTEQDMRWRTALEAVVLFYSHNFKGFKSKNKEREKYWSEKLDEIKKEKGY